MYFSDTKSLWPNILFASTLNVFDQLMRLKESNKALAELGTSLSQLVFNDFKNVFYE